MRLAILLLLALSLPARADVTIRNWNGSGFNVGNITVNRDIYGNALDAHAGRIVKFGSTYYLYGERHGCGFRLGTPRVGSNPGTDCGISVYTSPDIVNWTDQGYLLNAADLPWSNICTTIGNYDAGCYEPQVVYNAANNNYVVWLSTNAFAATPGNIGVATCTTPLGPCVRVSPDPVVLHPCGCSVSLFVDTGGIAYAIYQSNNNIYIDQLNADYTDSIGVGTSIPGSVGEGPLLFSDGTNYYALWGSVCFYCGPAQASSGPTGYYASSTNPIGTYGAIANFNTCGTQPFDVATIVEGGHTTYLYRGDNWTGTNNEGLANGTAQPLTVSGGVISPITCAATVTVQGVTPTTTPSVYPPMDQGNYFSVPGFWQGQLGANTITGICVVQASPAADWCLQTFVPTSSKLWAVGMAIGKNIYCNPGGYNCPAPDGSLEIDLVTTSSNVPASTIASVVIPVENLSWAPKFISIPFNVTGLTPGTTYGIELKPGAGNTQGFFSVSYDNGSFDGGFTPSYPAGLFRQSLDSGSTWHTQTGQAAMFATFPNAQPPPKTNLMLH